MAKFKDIEKVIRRYREWQALRPAMEQRLSPEEFAAQCVMALEDIGERLLELFDDRLPLGKLARDERALAVYRRLREFGELEAHEIADIEELEGDGYDGTAVKRRDRAFQLLSECGLAHWVPGHMLHLPPGSSAEAVGLDPAAVSAQAPSRPGSRGKWRLIERGLAGGASGPENRSRRLCDDMATPGSSSDGNGPRAHESHEE